jgi:cytochrome c nitrite reductase small subunit
MALINVLPIDCLVKDFFIAKAGINDLIHETMGDYQIGIGLSTNARKIINGNCIRCHASTIAATPMAQEEADCLLPEVPSLSGSRQRKRPRRNSS